MLVRASRSRDRAHALQNDTAVSYWKESTGWFIHFPGAGINSLSGVTVTEHPDGTITTSDVVGATIQKPSKGAATTPIAIKMTKGSCDDGR